MVHEFVNFQALSLLDQLIKLLLYFIVSLLCFVLNLLYFNFEVCDNFGQLLDLIVFLVALLYDHAIISLDYLLAYFGAFLFNQEGYH